MEKHKRSCLQGRKKVELNMRNNNGGCIGVVLLGGAFAIASLVAALAIKKGNNRKHTMNSETIDNCKKEDGTQGLLSILHESSSTLHQISCCTKHETSEIVVTQIETCELISPQSLISSMQCEKEITIHDTEQESTAKNGDSEEISRAVSDPKPMNVVGEENHIEIEIEGETAGVDIADAEQPGEEMSTLLQSSLSSIAEEKSSSIKGEEDEEECSPIESAFSTEEEEEEEEEESMRSLFSTEEDEDDDEYSPMQSTFSTEEEDDEEYSPMRSLFSTEEDEEEEDEENSPIESSFSTEEDEDEEEESPLQSSTEEDESVENVTEMEEESPEGTWSSSTESNYMKAIWPAEMIGVLSPESKEINNNNQTSVKKSDVKGSTANREAYSATKLDKSGNKDAQSKKENEEHVVINDQKQYSAKWQINVRLGLVLLLLLLLLANCLLPSQLSL